MPLSYSVAQPVPAASSYFFEPKKAMILDGKEKIQTKQVTNTENTAMKG
ncbi:hypothetical protein PQG46_10720 [Aquirufa nivalisilvae]